MRSSAKGLHHMASDVTIPTTHMRQYFGDPGVSDRKQVSITHTSSKPMFGCKVHVPVLIPTRMVQPCGLAMCASHS